jgi:hypothetical protein
VMWPTFEPAVFVAVAMGGSGVRCPEDCGQLSVLT